MSSHSPVRVEASHEKDRAVVEAPADVASPLPSELERFQLPAQVLTEGLTVGAIITVTSTGQERGQAMSLPDTDAELRLANITPTFIFEG